MDAYVKILKDKPEIEWQVFDNELKTKSYEQIQDECNRKIINKTIEIPDIDNLYYDNDVDGIIEEFCNILSEMAKHPIEEIYTGLNELQWYLDDGKGQRAISWNSLLIELDEQVELVNAINNGTYDDYKRKKHEEWLADL